MIEIARAARKDFLAVAALDRDAWIHAPQGENIPDGEHVWGVWCAHALTFVAKAQGRIVGASLAFPCADRQDLYCLHKIMVREQDRGRGVGSRLMDATLAETDRRGVDVFLTVDPSNRTALALYEKWGFTEREFVAGYYRDSEDRFVLTRRGPGRRHDGAAS